MKLIKLIHGVIAGILPSYVIYKIIAFFLLIRKDNISWTTEISIPLTTAILFWLLFILYSVFKKENVRSIWKLSFITSGILFIIFVFLSLITNGKDSDLITTSVKIQKNVHLESAKTIVFIDLTFAKNVIIFGIYGIIALIVGYKIRR